MRAALLSLLFVSALTGCEANYRYPCQDPSNWNNEECKKPACLATGECSENLVGQKAWEAAKESSAPAQVEETPAPVTEQTCPPSETGAE